MDSYSLKKRTEDGICRHGLNGQNRLKIRSLSCSRVDQLKHEVELAKKFKERMNEDLASTAINCKALRKDIKSCYQWGGPKYRHTPPGETHPTEALQARETFRNIKSDLDSKKDEVGRLLKEHRREIDGCKADVTIGNMQAWFAKYGEPRRGSGPTFERRLNQDKEKHVNPEREREAEKSERQRTVPCRGRHLPNVGRANAQTLRLGSGIWNTRSETDLVGTWTFRTQDKTPVVAH